MKTEVIRVDAANPDSTALARAGEVLRRGGLVAFPTETVYGLGANALDRAAVAAIFAAKGRPATNPLIVHLTGVEQVTAVAASWPAVAQKLAERFWPGPLSLVLEKGPQVADLVTAGGATVAVRAPRHPVARGLIEQARIPIAAPSANLSTRVSPTSAEHVLRTLEGRVDLVLDAGPTPGGIESTVLDVTVSPPRLLRPGLITPRQLEAVVGPIAMPSAAAGAKEPARSPGMMERHYAPSTPLECLAPSWPRVKELCELGLRIGWLALTPPKGAPPPGLFVLPLPDDPAGYSAQLYAALHTLEALGLDRIVVELPPDTESWLAVRDRLRRASAGN